MENTQNGGPYPETDPIVVEKPKAADPHIKFPIILQAASTNVSRYYTATVHILIYETGASHPGKVIVKTKTEAIPTGTTQFDVEFQFADSQWDTTEKGKYLPYSLMFSLHDGLGDMGKNILASGQFQPADKYSDQQDSTVHSKYLEYKPE